MCENDNSMQYAAVDDIKYMYEKYINDVRAHFSSAGFTAYLKDTFMGHGRYGNTPLHRDFLDALKEHIGNITEEAEKAPAAWRDAADEIMDFMLLKQTIDMDEPEGFTLVAAEQFAEPLIRFAGIEKLTEIEEYYSKLIKKRQRFEVHKKMYKKMAARLKSEK